MNYTIFERWHSEPKIEETLETALERCMAEGTIKLPLSHDDAMVLKNVSHEFFNLGMMRGMESKSKLTADEMEILKIYRKLNQSGKTELQAKATGLLAAQRHLPETDPEGYWHHGLT